MKKVILLMSAVLLVLSSAWADMGPKPSKLFNVTFKGYEAKDILRVRLISCQDEAGKICEECPGWGCPWIGCSFSPGKEVTKEQFRNPRFGKIDRWDEAFDKLFELGYLQHLRGDVYQFRGVMVDPRRKRDLEKYFISDEELKKEWKSLRNPDDCSLSVGEVDGRIKEFLNVYDVGLSMQSTAETCFSRAAGYGEYTYLEFNIAGKVLVSNLFGNKYFNEIYDVVVSKNAIDITSKGGETFKECRSRLFREDFKDKRAFDWWRSRIKKRKDRKTSMPETY